MNGCAPLGLANHDKTSLESGDSVAATPANEARIPGAAPGSIAWLSTRSEYWPPHVSEHWPPPDFRPLPGVACLQFGIGADGAGWLARLARSSWFAGLEPRAEDLAVSGGVSCGRWAMPDAWAAGTGVGAAAEAEAFFSSETSSEGLGCRGCRPAWAGPAEQAAALGLVGALRARRDPGGRALGVVVTVDARAIDGGGRVRPGAARQGCLRGARGCGAGHGRGRRPPAPLPTAGAEGAPPGPTGLRGPRRLSACLAAGPGRRPARGSPCWS